MLIENILVGITFHYAKDRLEYLRDVCLQIPFFGFHYKVLIITNTQDDEELWSIKNQVHFLSNFDVISMRPFGHPYFLPWGHLVLFNQHYLSDASISHFMYLEDDIKITPQNIVYWLRGRNELYQFGFYPSFVRFEKNYSDEKLYVTDITKPLRFRKAPRIKISSDYCYLSAPQPYQGMYLMDREMMEEYLKSSACSPDFGSWGIREKATQGLTFVNVPSGFHSRNLIGCNLSNNCVDQDALIHHLPNNYANNIHTEFGKLQTTQLVIF